MTAISSDKPKRTPEEQQLLEEMERLEGPLSPQDEELALEQARQIGDLPRC